MAWYDIDHSCGHTDRHQIYGTNSHGERDRKVQWLSGRVCEDCYKAEQARLDDELEQWVAGQEERHEMGELTGSAKQVAWAKDIRHKACKQVAVQLRDTKDPERLQAKADRVYGAACKATSATYWIDHRDDPGTALMALYLGIDATD